MTKVTAAYAISRTTRKVAYIDVREDKNIFSFQKHFLLKWQITYRYTRTLALRAQMFIVEIPKEQNTWYLFTTTSSH